MPFSPKRKSFFEIKWMHDPGTEQFLSGLVLLQHFSNKLTPFEMSEVLDYPKMYFFGPEATKIKGIPWAQNNNGEPDHHWFFFARSHVVFCRVRRHPG